MKPILFLSLLSAALLPAALLTAAVSGAAAAGTPGQARPRTQTRPPAAAKPQTQAKPRSYGARADSLNGIPGHAFGEPRSNFPELQATGLRDMEGYLYYEAQPGQEPNWFGKNSDHVRTLYRFYQDKFVIFEASATGDDRPLLEQETVYLFGPGRLQQQGLEAVRQWEGQRVLARLSSAQNHYELAVMSKTLLNQKAADKATQQKAEAAARAAKLRADNAPAGH